MIRRVTIRRVCSGRGGPVLAMRMSGWRLHPRWQGQAKTLAAALLARREVERTRRTVMRQRGTLGLSSFAEIWIGGDDV